MEIIKELRHEFLRDRVENFTKIENTKEILKTKTLYRRRNFSQKIEKTILRYSQLKRYKKNQ